MIDKIDIPKHRKGRYFCCRPDEKPGRLQSCYTHLYIVEIMQVVNVGGCHIVRMDNSIYPADLGSGRECDDLKVRKFWYDATMWTISIPDYKISGKYLVNLENFTELYDEVVLMRDDGNQWFGHS